MVLIFEGTQVDEHLPQNTIFFSHPLYPLPPFKFVGNNISSSRVAVTTGSGWRLGFKGLSSQFLSSSVAFISISTKRDSWNMFMNLLKVIALQWINGDKVVVVDGSEVVKPCPVRIYMVEIKDSGWWKG